LKIPDEKVQTAIAALEDEIFDQNCATFKPYIQVLLTVKPSLLCVMGGIMHI